MLTRQLDPSGVDAQAQKLRLERQDFRLRKVPTGYKVAQRIGSGWELLSEVYQSRREALVFIDTVVSK